MNIENIFQETLVLIREKEKLASTSFKSWFEPLKPVRSRGSVIYLASTDQFIIDWINKTYNDILVKYLTEASNGAITEYRLGIINTDGSFNCPEEDDEETDNTKEEKKPSDQAADSAVTVKHNPRSTGLIPQYTFDNFVVGEKNRFAHAASLVCAEQPGTVYNPLFIYGGVGLGKTHLMHAIGHFIKENNRDAKIAYFTTETFVNEFIKSIQTNSTEQFRQKYRRYDVILMDDIQFLSDKGVSQEEFFHTYNALYENGAQIVLSSDRPPKEIPKIEERLISRFEWGLQTEIEPPDLETRIAILQKKAEQQHVVINHKDKEVFFYIANQVDSNIRVLEGAFTTVVAHSKMKNQPITLSLAASALEKFATENKNKNISLELIIQTTADYFNIKSDDIRSSKRNAHIAYPRQIVMYLARELTGFTYDKIGDELGRHYSTVMHGDTEIREKIHSDKTTAKCVKEITEIIRRM